MSRVFQCDRCKKIYEKNRNELLKTINKPIMPDYDNWSISYVKFFSRTLDIETDFFNLCDDCLEQLYNWMFKGKSL